MEGCGLEASVLTVCISMDLRGYASHLLLLWCHRRPGEPWGCRGNSGVKNVAALAEPILGNVYRRQLSSTLLVSGSPSSPSDCD